MVSEYSTTNHGFFHTILINPMKFILFYFQTKLLTVASLKAAGVAIFTFVGMAIYDFVLPIYPFVMGVFFLTTLDMVTGVQAAKFKIRNEIKATGKAKTKITSRRKFRTVEKIGAYLFGILGAHAVFILFGKEMIPFELPVESPLVYVVSFPMIWTEFKSLDENIHVLTGVSFWKYVTRFKNPFFNEKVK